MLSYINFTGMQMKPLLFELITQTILPFNDLTMNISEGDKFGISFDNTPFKDYSLLITNVSFTSFKKITNKDMSANGFIYKPCFINFMENFRNISEEDSIVKLDFKLIKGEYENGNTFKNE